MIKMQHIFSYFMTPLELLGWYYIISRSMFLWKQWNKIDCEQDLFGRLVAFNEIIQNCFVFWWNHSNYLLLLFILFYLLLFVDKTIKMPRGQWLWCDDLLCMRQYVAHAATQNLISFLRIAPQSSSILRWRIDKWQRTHYNSPLL